jgi:hypothetical protein
MAIPPEFNNVEHLQSLVRRYVNKEIRSNFADLGDETWEPEVGTTRGSMRQALTHDDSDAVSTTLLRLFLYYFTYGQARALQAPVYGIPVQNLQESVKFHPQIRLYFYEDASQVEDFTSPATGEISFRLMGETENTINEAKAKVYANKIKNLFAANSGFLWHKGKELWVYYDLSRGYKLQVYSHNESEAKRVIEQILDIQGHSPDWDEHLSDATKRKHLSVAPTNKTDFIYGKQRKLPRRLPNAYVRFRFAELKIWGLPNDITLVDKTGVRPHPLISA